MRFILLLLFLGAATAGFSQKEANNWYFGNKFGFDFSKGYAEPLYDGEMLAREGSATMSDSKTGELLFYSNGIQVWNRQHQVMPNGSGLLSDLSSTQAALIVPFPGQARRYYLFAINSVRRDDPTTLPGLTYSIVNMALNGNLGDIEPESKNTRLLDNTSEKLTAVPHANGKDYWVITHGYNNDEFYVFLLTEAGVSEPETFSLGKYYGVGQDALTYDAAGYLKASPNGRRLACTTILSGPEAVELFDFDPVIGIISNPVSLGVTFPHYGVSFSPDNSKLYISGVYVTQFDLSRPTVQDIINSQVQITPTPSMSRYQSLQLGLDGWLYNNVDFGKFYIINYPNRKGLACEPKLVEFKLESEGRGIGLPNFMQHYFNGLEPKDTDASACNPDNAITVFPNPTESSFKIKVNADCYQVNQVTIFNSIGQQMASVQTDDVTREIYISALAAGLYVLQISTSTKEIIRKVIKK